MDQRVLINNKGMSLVEVVFALVILMIVGLALMQTALVGYRENTKNVLRDEAVSIAEQTMNDLRARTFTNTFMDTALVSMTTTTIVTRNFRNLQIDYSVKIKIDDINTDTKQAAIEVSWTTRGREYKHAIVNFVRKQS